MGIGYFKDFPEGTHSSGLFNLPQEKICFFSGEELIEPFFYWHGGVGRDIFANIKSLHTKMPAIMHDVWQGNQEFKKKGKRIF